MGVVWAEFVTLSIDFLPTSKLNRIGGHCAEGSWGENTAADVAKIWV